MQPRREVGPPVARPILREAIVFLLVLLLIAAGFAVRFVVKRYNGLQLLAEGVREAHSNIIVSMKKRIDLVNKLIDTASAYSDHEKLTHIAIARADNADSAVIAASAEAAGAVQTVLKMATHHPELRSSEMYNMLMLQLGEVESNLQDRRERYNGLVRQYNSQLSQIPTNLYAPALGFKQAPYFNVEDADSLEALKGFSSADGEVLKQMLGAAGKRVADGTRSATRVIADTSRVAGAKALEMGREAADRYQAQQGARTLNGAADPALTDLPPALPPEERPRLDA
jgi:LemA protein